MHDVEFLSTCDAAKLLKCTPENVRALERRGRLPALRTPSGVRIFRASDVRRLAERRTSGAGTAAHKFIPICVTGA